jgi:hypothetical protein
MREDFSEKTKKTLANRVAWRCSFPGCSRITIAAGHENEEATINLGEAAHIHAASPNGPRYNLDMNNEERTSIRNGIWMCRSHARLIDADFINYSANTLREWKKIAEEKNYKNVQELSVDPDIPGTLISLRHNLIFFGIWKSVIDSVWNFEVFSFVEGSIESLKDHSINFGNTHDLDKYIVVESQGDDGREINKLSWKLINRNMYEISCSVLPQTARISPHDLGGDIAMGDDFDIVVEEGDFAMVEGIDCAVQTLRSTLSSQFGDYFENPLVGSFFKSYFWKYNSNISLLNRLFKIEIIRLLSVSIFDNLAQKKSALLNFVNRIIETEVLDTTPKENQIPVRLFLEWGNGEQWSGTIRVWVGH